MKIDDLFVALETKLNRNDSPLLSNQSLGEQKKIIELLAPRTEEFFKRLITGESFFYKELFEEKNGEENTLVHGELEFPRKELYEKSDLEFIKDLELDNRSEHGFYSLRPAAKQILSTFLDKELYLSFYQLYFRNGQDKKTETAPLFYLPIALRQDSSGNLIIKASQVTPVLNKSLIKKLKETHDLDISYEALDFDPCEYASYINRIVSPHFFAVEDEVNIAQLPLSKYLKMHALVERSQQIEENERILALVRPPLSAGNSAESYQRNDFIQTILSALEEEKICAVEIPDSKLRRITVQKAAAATLRAGRNVGIFAKDLEVCSELAESLGDLQFKPGLDQVNSLNSFLNRNKEMVENSRDLMAPPAPDYQKYYNYIKQVEAAYDWNLGLEPVGFYERLANYTAIGEAKFRLDISDYSREDMEKDFDFFAYFASLPSLNRISFSSHPFYGLTSRADESTYEEIHRLLLKTYHDVEAMRKFIADESLGEWKLEELTDLQNVKSFIQHLEAIKNYSGFDLRYFEFDPAAVDYDGLANLKSLFASESSLKLSIDNIASDLVWQEDLAQLTLDADKRGKSRKLARKKLKSFLKIRDRNNLDSLEKLLKLYINNKAEIDSALLPFNGECGFDIRSLDDIIELEKDFEFIDEFKRYVTLFEDIDFASNPNVDRFFHEEAYRQQVTGEILPSLDRLATQLEVDFDELYAYFDSAEKRDYELMPFDDLLKHIDRQIGANYNVYLDYYNFVHSSQTISNQLREIINDLMAKNEPFKNLEVDFFKSVFSAYAEDSRDAVEQFVGDMRQARRYFIAERRGEWQRGLQSDCSAIRQAALNYLDTTTYRAAQRDIKSLIHQAADSRTDLIVEKYSDVFKAARPLVVSDRYLAGTPAVDTAIIVNPQDFDYLDLLLLLDRSEKVLFISASDNSEIVTTSFGPALKVENLPCRFRLDLKLLLTIVDFSKLQEHLSNLIEVNANKLGFLLERDYVYDREIYPLVLRRPGVDKPAFLPIPDIAIESGREYIETELASLIKHLYDVELVIFNTAEMALYTEEALRELTGAGDPDLKLAALRDSQSDEALPQEEPQDNDSEQRLKEYREQLLALRSTFKPRPIFDPEQPSDGSSGYLQSLLPFPLSTVDQFPPYIKTAFMMLVDSGKVELDKGFIMPVDRSAVTLHSGDGKMDLICDLELERAVILYLSSFSFLAKSSLLKEIATVIEISDADPVFRKRLEKVLLRLSRDRKIDCSDEKHLTLFKNMTLNHLK